MKRVVIVLALLIVISMVSADTISIPELFKKEASSDEGVEEGMKIYFYAGNKLIASKDNNELQFHYRDRMGSDSKSKQLPFGQELVDSGNRFEFTGKELDSDSDLHYFNARYYDSRIGKFLSVDPVKDELPYSYVGNNPMNYVDPSGTTLVNINYDVDLRSHYSSGARGLIMKAFELLKAMPDTEISEGAGSWLNQLNPDGTFESRLIPSDQLEIGVEYLPSAEGEYMAFQNIFLIDSGLFNVVIKDEVDVFLLLLHETSHFIDYPGSAKPGHLSIEGGGNPFFNYLDLKKAEFVSKIGELESEGRYQELRDITVEFKRLHYSSVNEIINTERRAYNSMRYGVEWLYSDGKIDSQRRDDLLSEIDSDEYNRINPLINTRDQMDGAMDYAIESIDNKIAEGTN